MRFHEPLDGLFRNRTSVRVLRVLARFPAKEFTGRELAAEAGTSPPNTIQALNGLRAHGLVERRTVGRAQLWRFRREHALAAPLRGVFAAEKTASERPWGIVTVALSQIPGVERIALFGSVARGDERPDSDIDLLVIVGSGRAKKKAEPAVDGLRAQVARRFGNRLSPVVLTRDEFASRRSATLRKSVLHDGIVLWERSP